MSETSLLPRENKFTSWWISSRTSLAIYFFLAMTALTVFMVPLGNGDELWNYQFASNILAGNLPYRDFNIVQTPLSAYICVPFLFFFGRGVFAYRVAGFVVNALMAIELYRVCLKASGSKGISFATSAVLSMLNVSQIIFNYNSLGALVLLVVLDLELSARDSAHKQVLIGYIVGFLPLIKQTFGALAVAANLVVALVRIFAYKQNKRTQFLRILASGVPLLGYIGFLLVTGTFDDFWEYAILGIATFKHRLTYVQMLLFVPIYIIPSLIIAAGQVLAIYLTVKKKITPAQVASIVFCIAWYAVAYPLCDPSHFLLILYLAVPALFALLPSMELLERCGKKAFMAVGVVFCIISVIFGVPFGTELVASKYEAYRYIPVESYAEHALDLVISYAREQEEKGYEVKFASSYAATYHIPMNRYEKDWSMMLVGNLGLITVEEMVETDCARLYLVRQPSASAIDQSYRELIQYICDNYTRVDAVGEYEVYVTDTALFGPHDDPTVGAGPN